MPSLFTGSTFEVFAGPEQTRFVAHTSVLEKSEKLRALTRGIWKESAECKVVLEEWDPETVGRLLEWLYTGDYESTLPTAEAARSKAQALQARVSEGTTPFMWTDERPTITLKEAESRSKAPLTCLKDIRFNNDEPKVAPSHAETFELWAATHRQDHVILDCEATLFAHAKLYALADYMLLPALQAQVFQRLKAVLIFISPSADIFNPDFESASAHMAKLPAVRHIITLGEYVYANTTRTESEEEPLRKLISTFIALNYDQFDDDAGVVQAFLEQGGEFQDDVHDKVRRTLFGLKERLKGLTKARGRWGLAEDDWN